MNFKGTLRRTLAMLLVLIFALSNMGLAEMAEQIAESIPAAEPQIEEVAAEEAAPVEEQEAEEEAAPAEEEATEPAEEPEPTVQVVAYQIDEHSFFADAEGTVYDGELAYQWEIADGEDWVAIEGATDAVYSADIDALLDNSFRAVVTAGETAVASDPVAYDAEAYGVANMAVEEPVMLEDSVELAEVNVAPTTKPVFSIGGTGKLIVSGTSTDSLTVTSSSSHTEGEKVLWVLTGDYAKYFQFGNVEGATTTTGTVSGTSIPEVTIKVNKKKVADAAKDTGLTADGTAKVEVVCYITDSETTMETEETAKQAVKDGKALRNLESAPVTFAALPVLTPNDFKVTYSHTKASETGDVFWQSKVDSKTSNVATFKVVTTDGEETELAAPYTFQWQASAIKGSKGAASADVTFSNDTTNAAQMNIAQLTSSNMFTEAEKTATIKCTVTNGTEGETAEQTAEIKIRALADTLTIKKAADGAALAGTKIVAGDSLDVKVEPSFSDPTLYTAVKPLTLYDDTYTWDNQMVDSASEAATVQAAKDTKSATLKVVQNASGNLKVTVKSNADSSVTTSLNTEVTVEKLPAKDDVTVDSTEFTLIRGGSAQQIKHELQVKFKTAATPEANTSIAGLKLTADDQTRAKQWLTFADDKFDKPLEESGSKVSVEIGISGTSSGNTSADGGPVLLKLVYPYWDAEKGATTGEIPIKVNVVDKVDSLSLSSTDIKLDRESITMPRTGESGYEWAKTKAWLNPEKVDPGFKVNWSFTVKEAGSTAHNDFLAGTDNDDRSFTLTAQEDKYVNAKVIEELAEGTGLTVTITATLPDILVGEVPAAATVSREIPLYIAPDSIELAPLEQQTDGTMKAGAAYQNPGTTDVQGGSGITIQMKATAKVGTFAPDDGKGNKVTRVEFDWLPGPDETDDGLIEEVTVGADGSLDWTPNHNGTYIVKMYSMDTDFVYPADDNFMLNVQKAPDHVTAKEEHGRETVSLTSGSNTPTGTLNIVAVATNSDSEKNVYTKDIEWTLEPGVTGKALDKSHISDKAPEGGAEADLFWLTYDPDDPSTAVLHWSELTQSKIASDYEGRTITITPSVKNSGAGKTPLTLTLKTTLDDTNLTGWDAKLGFSNKEKHTTTNDYIKLAQGQSMAIETNFPEGEVGALGNKSIKDVLEGYKIEVKFDNDTTGGDTANAANANLEDWFEFNTDDMTITAKEPDTTSKKNLLTNAKQHARFTATVSVPDVKDHDDPQGACIKKVLYFEIVSKPTAVKFAKSNEQPYKRGYSAASLNKTTKDLNGDPTSGNKLPNSLHSLDKINVYAYAVCIDEDKHVLETTEKVDSLNISGGATAEEVTGLTISTQGCHWTIRNDGTNGTTALITASASGATGSAEIRLVDETAIIFVDGGKTPGDCAKASGDDKHHVWRAVTDEMKKRGTFQSFSSTGDSPNLSTKGPDASRHYYVCVVCGKVSDKLSGHGYKQWSALNRAKHADGTLYTEDEIKWKNPTSHLGDIVCDACGFICTHAEKLTPAIYENSSYHIGTCPICGLDIKEAHVDTNPKDGTCDVCGDSAASPKFADGDLKVMVVGGEKYVPNLTVKDTKEFTVAYSAAGWEDYIDVAADGTVTAKKVTDPANPAILTAEVTSSSKTTSGSKATATIKIAVKERIAAINLVSDHHNVGDETKAYTVYGAEPIKITATFPGTTNPDWSGYTWTLASPSDLEFVYKDKKGEWQPYSMSSGGTSTPTGQSATNVPLADKAGIGVCSPIVSGGVTTAEIYVRVISTYDKTKANNQSITVTLKPTATQKDVNGKVLDPVEGEIKVEVLHLLSQTITSAADGQDVSSDMTKKLYLGMSAGSATIPYQIVQGDSIVASLMEDAKTPFDSRYGQVSYKLLGDTASDTKNWGAADIRNWAEVTGSNTITTKASDSSTNVLSASRPSVTLTLRAIITLETMDKTVTPAKPAKVCFDRKIKIMPAPKAVTIKYFDPTSTETTDAKKWKAVDGPITVTEGEELLLTVEVEKDALTTIGAKDVAFEWPTAEFENKAYMWEATGKDANGYKLTVKKGASSTISIPVICYGVSVAPIEINVQRQATNITVTSDTAAVGAGERVKNANNSRGPKQITLTANLLPEGAKDNLSWKAYYTTDGVKKNGEIGQITTLLSNAQGQDKTKTSLTIDVPTSVEQVSAAKGYGVLVEVTAEKAKDENGKARTGSTWFTIHPAPTSNAGLLLELAKPISGSMYVMTVGETTEITKHGYDTEKNYGWSGSPEIEVIPKTTKLNNTAEGAPTEVLSVETREDGKVYVTGTAEGTATLSITSYETLAGSVTKTITVRVAPKVDEVRFETKSLKNPDEITVDGTPKTIGASLLTAYRKSGASDSVTDCYDAMVLLKAKPEGYVEITKNGSNWEIKGKKAGTVEIYAAVGEGANEVRSENSITLNVKNTPTGIRFYQNDVEVGPQILQVKGKTEKITLVAKTYPEDSFGAVEILKPTGTAVEYNLTNNNTTIDLTPDAVGITTITAQVKNPAFSGTAAPNNPEFLQGQIEVVVTEEDTGSGTVTPDVPTSVEVVGKQAIGPGEKTDVVAPGIEDADATGIVWEITEGASRAKIEGSGARIKVVGGESAGLATVTATLNGKSVGEAQVNILTAIEGISFNNKTNAYALNKDERVMLVPDIEGYDSVVEGGADPDESDIVAYTMSTADTPYVNLDYDAQGHAYAVGVKQNTKNKTTKAKAYMITATAFGGKTAQIAVTMKSNKVNTGFSIPQNGAILSMAEGDSVTITPTWTPSGVTASLEWQIEPDDGCITRTGDDKATTLKVEEGADGYYKVTVKEAGYPDRPEQVFGIDIVEKADASATIAYSKIGVAAKPVAATAVTLAVGERIQALLMNGEEVMAATGWTSSKDKYVSVDNTGVVTVLKAYKKDITITAPNQKTFTVKAIKAPSVSKFKFEAPATVGVGEEFAVTYSCSGYKGDGAYLADIIANNEEVGFAPVEGKANTYTFSEPGIVTLTGNTTFGKTPKTVTVTVLPAPDVDALEIVGTDKIAKGQTIQLGVPLYEEEPGYANITWTVDGKPVTSTTKKTKTAVKNITAKLVSNNVIEIAATSKAATGTIAVTATAAGYPDMEPATFTLNATAPDASIAGGKIVFDKSVIGVGETTVAGVMNAEGMPVTGGIKYSVAKADKKVVSISGNKFTAKKPGAVTVTAKLGSSSITGTLYIVTESTLALNMKPSKMAAGEEARVNIQITGYQATGMTLSEEVADDFNTIGMLSVTSSNPGLVEAEIVETEDVEPAEDGVVRDYTLVLRAASDVSTTKNKYPTATVTLNKFGKKFQVMKIQVVGETDPAELRFPKKIWIEAGKSMALTPSTGDATEAGNIEWTIDPEKNAAKMVFDKNGKLFVPKGTAAGLITELDGVAGEQSFHLIATVGQKVKSNKNFRIVPPKTTVGVGEKMLMDVQFDAPYGGVITWKSSKPAVASIDSATGLLVGKQEGKTTKITAKVNGKTSKAVVITVGSNPTSIEFEKSEYIVTSAGEEITVKATMTGGTTAQDPAKESAYVISVVKNDAGLINEDESDLSAGKVVISATPTLGTSATLHVETYNGLTDECIIVYGKPEGSGSVTPPPADLTPASIELMLLGAPLTNGESMTLEEGDTLAPVAVVKNKSNINITKDVTVAWSSTDKNNCIQLDTATGALVAKSTTWSAETKKNGADEAITVTASVMAGETELKAEYKINITVVMSGDHFLLRTLQRADVETMIKSDKLDVMLELTDAAQSNGPMGLTNATLKALTNNIIVTSKASNRWELNAVAVGTAELELSARVDGKDYSVKKTIQINDLPTSNDITFAEGVNTANNIMIVGSEEPATFVVTLGKDFKGKLGDQVKASAYTLENGADGKPVPLTTVSVVEKTFAADEKAPDGKAFVLTCSEAQRELTPKFRVIVTAYDENTKKEFTVEVRKGIANDNDNIHDIEITTMPELTKEELMKENTRKISIGVGENVTLTASTDRTWTSGLKWIITSNVPAADKDKIYVDNKGNGVAEFHYEKEINTAQTVTLKAVRGGMPSTDTALKGTGVTVTVCPQPTKANVGTGVSIKATFKNKNTTDAVEGKNIVLGVGERVDAIVHFGSQPCYTNTVFWDTDSTDVIKITRDANAPKAVIEGVNPTGSSTVELTAYAGTDNTGVKLATIQVQVKEAPNNDEIKIISGASGNTEFTFSLSWNELGTDPQVSLNLDAAKVSGTYNLTTRDTMVKVAPDTNKKNLWNISRADGAPGTIDSDLTVTLTLSSEDGSFVKNYTLTVKK